MAKAPPDLNYIVYRTVHLPTGRFYIGRHVTNKLDDGYMGSGIVITRLLKKYPLTEFKREILHETVTFNEMLLLEDAEILKVLNHELCLNRIVGDPSTQGISKHAELTKHKISIKLTGHPGWNKGKKMSLEVCKIVSAGMMGRKATLGFTGKKHSPVALTKMQGKRNHIRNDMIGNKNLKEAGKKSWEPGGARRIAFERKNKNG